MTINATNQVVVDRSVGNASEFVYGGFGFTSAGALCLDDADPAESVFNAGFRVNPTGCIYVITVTAVTDVWLQGLRCSSAGRLVVQASAGSAFVNGNPLGAALVLAVSA